MRKVLTTNTYGDGHKTYSLRYILKAAINGYTTLGWVKKQDQSWCLEWRDGDEFDEILKDRMIDNFNKAIESFIEQRKSTTLISSHEKDID